jgi:1-acyl-sn-glycerol-3-phosphate acyltransferase
MAEDRPGPASRVGTALGNGCLKLAGWKHLGQPPAMPKCVVVAAPHTSNWDFVLMLLVSLARRKRFGWAGKHTLFRPPFGAIMRALGGVPIDRNARRGATQQLVSAFERADRLTLVITPEGTRQRTEHWRSGFYHVARLAGVPIVLGLLDYRTQEAGFGPTLVPTGDVTRDMDQIRAFYAGRTGRRPDHFGPVRLAEEPVTDREDAAP